MIKTSLWPTDVYECDIEEIQRQLIHAQIVSYAAQDVPPEDMNKFGAFDSIKQELSSLGQVSIVDAWLRYAAPTSDNNFEIHSDSHKGTDYIGVMWISGDEGAGGDIVLYDPAWRNPQHIRHEYSQPYSVKHRITFKLGHLTIFPSNVWHEVTAYQGVAERISLNLAINIDGLNN